jgi:diaminopimelate decarboxylase
VSAPLDFFKYSAGELKVDGVTLSQIAKKNGTPVYVYSAQAFLKPLQDLQRGLHGIDHLVCFAVKSNSNISILKMLGRAGAGMDLVSGGELFRVRKAGVPGERIVFSGVGKTEEEIEVALSNKIFSFNVESLPELRLINCVALRKKVRARVALRFNPDVNAKTHPYISTGLKKNKFGLNRKEIVAALPEISKMKAITVAGLSIHIGSQLLSLKPLEESFVRVKDLAREIEPKLHAPLEFFDLGGGVGISYDREKPKSPAIDDYCALIQKHFGPRAKDFPKDLKAKKIVLEPGRLIAGNSGVLVSEVLFRKKRDTKDFLIIDAAMNDLLRPALYGSFHDMLPVKKTGGSVRLTDIVGPVCETSDCFASDRKLPSKLDAGDFIAILSSGAYGFSMASNYNSRPRPPEVLVQNGRAKIIRKRETYQDLVRGEENV